MPEQTVVSEQKVEVKQEPVKKVEDIVSRVASFQPETKKPTDEQPIFNVNDIDKIEDPKAREYARNAHKELERTYQKKFQDIAEIKKALESKTEPSSWTTEKIQNLLKDPSFIQAAQGIIGNSQPEQDQEFSNLTDAEKQRIARIEKEHQMFLQQQNQFFLKQQDEQLKSKFPNYKPEAVDTITADLLQGKVNNTREYIWKAYDYEDAVNRAYQLGKKDALGEINNNNSVSSFSESGVSTSQPTSSVKMEDGESRENFFKRLYAANLAKQKKS